MKYSEMLYQERDGAAYVTFTGTPCGDVTFILSEGDITVRKTGERPFALRHRYDDAAADKYIEVTGISPGRISLRYNSFDYDIGIEMGELSERDIVYKEGIKLDFTI